MSVTDTDQQAEIERLRARVTALEQELTEQAERSERIVAEAQERLYWLDRWHVDLNVLMRRPGAGAARAAFRALRKGTRGLKRLKRMLIRSS
jgi:hypothetical protein